MQDVVIVGAGMTGSWAAKRLSEAGARVLLLEAGPQITPAAVSDEAPWTLAKRAQRAIRQRVQSQHPVYWQANPDLFVDDIDQPFESNGTPPYCWIRGRQVGGRSLTWGGIMLRLSDQDLRAADQDGHGRSWPIRYRDLVDSYDRIELCFSVSGSNENLSSVPDGNFVPPPPLTPAELGFKRAVESRWRDRRVVHCRGVANMAPPSGQVWPQRCVQSRVLPDALGTGLVELRPDCIVTRIVSAPGGKNVVGVQCVDRRTKDRAEFRARVVVLCASTIESIRILLNSGDERHPRGLANSSGMLGKCLLDHAAVWAVGCGEQDAGGQTFPLGGAHGFLIPRFRNLLGREKRFVRGYGIWGTAGRMPPRDSGKMLWTLCAMLEVLPRASNGVQLSETLKDAWGIPVPAIHMSYSRNEHLMMNDARESLLEMAATVGWTVTEQGCMSPGGLVHELGGAAMGDDPNNSVLNAFNQSWDVPNLFVLDGACFVSSAWQNPTLTMMALADRACSYVSRELAAGHL
jgi:choline dehydrogenase-like flavoprotein